MGNSSSQEEVGHRSNQSKPPSSSSGKERKPQEDQVPRIPQTFDRTTKPQATTAVSKESVTANRSSSQSGNSSDTSRMNEISSNLDRTEYSHVESVGLEQGTSNDGSIKRDSHEESKDPQTSPPKSVTSKDPPPVRPGLRRKSTILLDEHENELEEEEQELRKLKLNSSGPATLSEKPLSRAGSGEEIELNHTDYSSGRIATVIEWRQGGNKVYVTGSFTGWRKMIKLSKNEAGNFSTTIRLPAGTHRLRFVVDNEMRCSDYLATATDSMGNLVNYIEVGEQEDSRERLYKEDHIVIQDEKNDGEKYERMEEDDDDAMIQEPALEYGSEIPSVFTDPEVMDRFVSSDFVTPPQLPPHLEGVILNSNSTEKDNNSVLPIPNHVVLNHLATTSIKHNVLAVASISRYSRKYVTQILYAPL